MRTLVAIGTLLFCVSSALAQQQERKLIDRLLRPDMSLANPAQHKKFSTNRLVSLDKSVRTREFYLPPTRAGKSFPEGRAITPHQFAARHFRAADSAAYISTRTQLKNDTVIATPSANDGTRVAAESNKPAVASRQYPGLGPFLEKGKSQASLRVENPPLTIEQVRELLNKSK